MLPGIFRAFEALNALRFGFFLLAHGPCFCVPEFIRAKTKSPRGQLLWYAGLKIFGIKLLEGQLFPPARDGLDATRSVACTATTHRLAGQIHTCSGYDAWRTRVNRGVHEKNECIQPI